VLDQRRSRLRQVRRGGVQHQRARHRSERRPINTSAHVRFGVAGAQRYPGESGYRGAGGHSGHHVERHRAAGHRLRFGDHGVRGERIPGDQPHHRPPRLRFGNQVLGDVGGFAHRGTDFGILGGPGVDVGGYVGVDHQQLGAAQQMLRSHGEHSGTAGTGTDEGNPSGGLADTAHLPTRFPLRPADLVGAAPG
jgi:hypothetical protein